MLNAAPQVAVQAASQAPADVFSTVNQSVSELAATARQIERDLTGFPSPAMQERARRELGRLIAKAEALRSRLPDPEGLRTGSGAQRAARAIAVAMRDGGARPQLKAVADLLECGEAETRGLLLRAVLKGWAHNADGVWDLTLEGQRVLYGSAPSEPVQ